MTLDKLVVIANKFKPQNQIIDIQAFGNGNINDTFLVTLNGETDKYFVLQRINTQVFPQPKLVMQNISTVTEHMSQHLARDNNLTGNRRWEIPSVLLTRDGEDYWLDTDGLFWRAITFIDNSQSFDTIQNLEQATEIGYALGLFHRLISDLSPEKLADTLPGFHITPGYLKQYDEVMAKNRGKETLEVKYCHKFISDRRGLVNVLEDAKMRSLLPMRPIHGDPKINNVMMDRDTKVAIAMIDLDTVKPGLIHYDIGDCLRSGCNLLGEETEDWQLIYFDTDIARAILQGYLSQAKEFLINNDYEYLYDGIRLLAFELGLRFFTDYLAGNVYFKAKYETHNLARALVQFKLTESIESQSKAISSMIKKLK
jgi:hypothetical protein